MTPPRIPRWLISRAFDEETAEALLGDLTEEFGRRARVGRLRAFLWFWWEAVTSIVSARWQRWRHPVLMPPREASGRASFLDNFRHDLTFGVRTLLAAPVFTAAAVITLAIGIGAFTAIGTAASRALLRPLPYAEGHRLVFLGHPNPDGSIGNVGFETFADWRSRAKGFDQFSIIRGWTPTLVTADGAISLSAMRVSWNYFRMLGVKPALGRDFDEADDHPDQWRVVVISDGLWRRQFGARRDILESTVDFNGRPFRIIGVMPPEFEPLVSRHFFTRAELWGPLGYAIGGASSCRTCQHLKLIGRLREGSSLQQATVELETIHGLMRREHPSDYTEVAPKTTMLEDELSRRVRGPLQVLFGAVLFVLLVAASNVAGLMLARAADRRRELTLRAALGASRGRIIGQLVTESLIIAAVATPVGLVLARAGLGVLGAIAPSSLHGLDQASIDFSLIAIALLTSVLSVVLFGLIPAVASSRTDLRGALGSGRHSSGRGLVRSRQWLMTVQIAAALVVAAAAGLMYRSVDRLLGVDPGFESRGVFTASLSLVGPPWAEDSAVRTFQQQLLERVAALPGVEHAALTGQVPLGDNYDRWGFRIEGRTYASDSEAPEAERYSVTPGYFQAMGIPLKRGRLVDARDVDGGELVVVVNETAARTLWAGQDPIDSHVRLGSPTTPLRRVVGIVGDVRHYALGEPANAQMYLPQTQSTDSYLVLVAKTSADASALAGPVRQAVASIARDVPVYDVATLDERLSRSVASRRFLMLLLAAFAITTILIAAVGLYGVVAQHVASRRREFGIRIALGASRANIVRLALTSGLRFGAVGILAGLGASLLLGRVLGSQLYETTPADPLTLAGAAAALILPAAVAHWAPLRRAVKVDPVATLKSD